MSEAVGWVLVGALIAASCSGCAGTGDDGDDKDAWAPGVQQGKADGNVVEKGPIRFIAADSQGTIDFLPLNERHGYWFEARAGVRIRVAMDAVDSSLDSYLALITPSGTTLIEPAWDDGGEGTNAWIDSLELPEAGKYGLLALSYRDRSEGDYELRLICLSDSCSPEQEDHFADLTGRTLQSSVYAIELPEPADYTIDPTQLNPVREDEFNDVVMPDVRALAFYSVEKNDWVDVAFDYIDNYCFARRRAVDAYLWFGEELKATYEEQMGSEPYPLKKYLLPGFTNEDFVNESWVETARIKVIGELKAGSATWNNHEAAAVNTENGLRVIDPSFDETMILPLDEWFTYFAPEATNRTCEPVSTEMMGEINTQLIITQQFGGEWDEEIPRCGYTFGQRLDSEDMTTFTAYFFGTPVEKFLSARFWKAFEEDLLKASEGY